MSKAEQNANVMFARQCLHNLRRDLDDSVAVKLLNQLDRSLRCGDMSEVIRLCSLTSDIVKSDVAPWQIRERLQVISLLRFPMQALDEEAIVKKTREFVSSLTLSLNDSDRDIWVEAGKLLSRVLPTPSQLKKGSHGPGITAETCDALIKRDVIWVSPRLRAYKNSLHYVPDNCGGWLEFRLRDTPAKVVCVPKDHKTLRMISAEPTQTQYVQQAWRREFEYNLRRDCVFRSIRIDKQETQHALLRAGCATIDLSSASDTIRVKHIMLLKLALSQRESLLMLRTPLQTFRGKIMPTQGLYPMGAACCFPFETALFYALCFCYIVAETGKPPRYLGVYGDDICCEPYLAGGIRSFLQRSGFAINHDKSYTVGNFFESCGLNLYKSTDVTPLKLKKLPPVSPQDVANITYAEYAKRVLLTYPNLSKFLTSLVLFKQQERWNPSLQRREVSVLLEKRTLVRSPRVAYYDALHGNTGDVPSVVVTTTHGWSPLGF